VKFWGFLLGTIFLLWVSRKSLLSPHSHGFYRFFAWESIALLVVLNLPHWFDQPFRWHQIISWMLLFVSIIVALAGLFQLKRLGSPGGDRQDDTLLSLEKTTRLVTSGIFRYIRHPLYASLLLLAVGISFKQVSWSNAILAALAVAFLSITASIEERENLAYFGKPYQEYQTQTKKFIPFIY